MNKIHFMSWGLLFAVSNRDLGFAVFTFPYCLKVNMKKNNVC